MTRLPREPLDADERALAARLPRLHGRDEPDAAMDARILAAAHAALSPAPVAKRRRGWIVPLTAAASVSLAVGLAWRLQSPPAPGIAPASAPVASEVASGENDQRFMDSVDAPPPSANAVQSRPVPMVSPARQQALPTGDAARIAREVAPTEPAAESTSAAPMFVPPPPAASMADAMPVEVAAPPPAPPAPPAPVTTQGAMARSAPTDVGASATGAAMPAQAKRIRQNEAEAAATLDTVTSEEFAKAVDEEDVPPATMDAPAARDAWLRRIGELQQQGRVDDAKASLAEFRRRYPDAVLPPELRKLEP